MAILHTVRAPAALHACLARAQGGDAILLIEDAVYAARTPLAAPGLCLYVLAPDLAARGIGAAEVDAAFTIVDDSGFVDLAVECHASIAWV